MHYIELAGTLTADVKLAAGVKLLTTVTVCSFHVIRQ
jgi:hypothetical protein